MPQPALEATAGKREQEALPAGPSKRQRAEGGVADLADSTGMTEGGQAAVVAWRLQAVLGARVTGEVRLRRALAVELLDRRQTSGLLRILGEAAPLHGLQHLKRVRSVKEPGPGAASVQLLLWQVEDLGHDGEDRPAAALARLADLGVPAAGLGRVTEEEVAAWQPVTRAQFDRLRATPSYWPTAFHEDKQLESLLAGSHALWGPGPRAEQERMLELAGRDGGVVADGGHVVAVVDRGSGPRHPLGHVAMLLVDLVARAQGGGASALTVGPAHPSVTGSQTAPGAGVPATGPYLCTGYTVYLAREPCHMCAMALLHSRAALLLYCRPTRDGALASAYRLLDREGLNHRYQVFRAVASGEERNEGLCC